MALITMLLILMDTELSTPELASSSVLGQNVATPRDNPHKVDLASIRRNAR